MRWPAGPTRGRGRRAPVEFVFVSTNPHTTNPPAHHDYLLAPARLLRFQQQAPRVSRGLSAPIPFLYSEFNPDPKCGRPPCRLNILSRADQSVMLGINLVALPPPPSARAGGAEGRTRDCLGEGRMGSRR